MSIYFWYFLFKFLCYNSLYFDNNSYTYVDNNILSLAVNIDDFEIIPTENLEIQVGKLSRYGPDCYGCTGLLYCPDSDGNYHYLTNDVESTFFNDKEYGKVHILASDPTLFPCGTIIHVVNDNMDIIGVCMDTGIAMRNAWRLYGNVLIDLAFTGESITAHVTNNNTKFTVLRWGW